MSAAKGGKLARAGAVALALMAPSHAMAAQESTPPEEPPRFRIDLTEAPEPDSKAWEDPARISLTIDPNGPDRFSAQVNLEAEWRVSPVRSRERPFVRRRAVGGNLIWNRETGGDDRQNNLEVGAYYAVDYNPGTRSRGEVDFSSRFSLDYARTAEYPDTSSATCLATPALPQCQTQFKESVRASASAVPFFPGVDRTPEGLGFSFSIAPQLGLDYDHLINSPIDTDTGLRTSGGYFSAKAGLGLTIVPTFDDPEFELEATVQLRQQIFASSSRRPSIDASAILFEASATYYFVRPTEEDDWRAGIGITYTRGDDPLNGRSDVNRIVLALRIGRY